MMTDGRVTRTAEGRGGGRNGGVPPLVASIVVDNNEVGFYAFEANTGRAVTSAKEPVADAACRDGWAEQDAMAMVRAAELCVRSAVIAPNEVMGARVVAVGVANHRGSVVAWSRRTGEPLCNAIMGSDNRTVPLVDEYLRTSDVHRFRAVCGLPFSPLFSAFKIKWLMDNDEKVRRAHKDGDCCFGTVDSWLVWNLTGGSKGGVFATDCSNAAYTFLMNINTLEWDKRLLNFFGISSNCLPEIKSSSELYGKIAEGPLKGTAISGVIGNRQASLVGHRCFRRGLTKAVLDESGSIFTVTGDNKIFSNNGLLTTVAYQFESRPVYALEGTIASAGKAIDWTKQCLNATESDNECLSSVIPTEKIKQLPYFVPAYTGLYAPHWKPDARCIIVGIDEHVRRADIVKAAMESVCFQIQDILEASNKDTNIPIEKIKVDGDLSNHKFIMQTLANITNTTIEVAMFKDMTALGAAMAAGYAPSINVWNVLCMPEDVGVLYKSKITDDERNRRIFDWRRATKRSYNWVETKKYVDYLWISAPLIGSILLLGIYYAFKR